MMFSSRNFQLWLCCQFFHVFYVRPQVTGQPMTGSYLVRHSPLGQVAQDNVCCCSVTQSCLTFCDSIDCSMPGTGEPGGLLSLGSHRVGHDWSDLAAAAAAAALYLGHILQNRVWKTKHLVSFPPSLLNLPSIKLPPKSHNSLVKYFV